MARDKRGLNKIGKEKYGFDFKTELEIYKYLSCYRMSRKSRRTLSNDKKFDSYKKWKEYIVNTYKEKEYEDLVEFSRYLNQRKRNANTDYSYWGLIVPILLTILLTNVFGMLSRVNFGDFPMDNVIVTICTLVVWSIVGTLLIIVFIFPIFLLIYYILKPYFDTEIEKNFLEDYKEIVDALVNVKCNYP